ncbi:MAG TPA: Xaa-Pro aminopeptidase [Methylophilaceae bacterium]|nr:Xaa-Pro aminopeptidase [Methylophilaceae bacterium]
MSNARHFQSHRSTLLDAMGSGIAIIPTATEKVRNRDSQYPYRYDSYFYYLTGFQEPEAVLVLIAGESPKSILFCREKDHDREIWDGFRYGPDKAKVEFGFDETYPISQLDEMAPKLMANQDRLFYTLGSSMEWDTRIAGWINQLKAQTRSGTHAPAEIVDLHSRIDNLRLIKSEFEIDTMRRAARISAAAHIRAMRKAKPGVMEYELEAELLHEFYRQGSRAPAYTSIVATGANACVLHYVENNVQLKDGDLVLIDAGCELHGYASDITRTFPANGRFTSPQRDLYELVLAAQAAAIEKAYPGSHWNAPHDAAVEVLIRGFIDLGLCKGTPEAVLESGDYRRFYMHRTGHWLGLDVHDAGEYKSKDGNWRLLEPGMMMTVEPGCYVRPSDDVPEQFWNVGIRIEDDVLITPQGNDILTRDAPKSIADIEALMVGA